MAKILKSNNNIRSRNSIRSTDSIRRSNRIRSKTSGSSSWKAGFNMNSSACESPTGFMSLFFGWEPTQGWNMAGALRLIVPSPLFLGDWKNHKEKEEEQVIKHPKREKARKLDVCKPCPHRHPGLPTVPSVSEMALKRWKPSCQHVNKHKEALFLPIYHLQWDILTVS